MKRQMSLMDDEYDQYIRLNDDHLELLIYPNGNGYPIEYDRINSAPKMLGWIHHLCGKGNVTTNHIEALIEAAKELGVPINWHC